MTKHVIQFSGGITSWATARTVRDQFGTSDMVLLFADTLVEDDDLYRFNRDVERNLGIPITRVADGRTPHQVFKDVRFLGNSKIAPCSHLLKQEPCRQWLEANADPDDTVLYVGIDWTEMGRLPGIVGNWLPWKVEAPLCEPPYYDKAHWITEARKVGIDEPRLYKLGFAHNNCGGACVRGGQASWRRLMQVFPDRYAAEERAEEELRVHLDADVAILRDRKDGVSRPLPLREFRERFAAQDAEPSFFDPNDWGGCGCMTSFAQPEPAAVPS